MAELGDLLSAGDGAGKRVPDVNIEMLDYDFVTKCEDPSLLRAILRRLQSGKDGLYPDLVAHTEKRLLSIMPDGERKRIVAMKSEPSHNEVAEAEESLLMWEQGIKAADNTLRSSAMASEAIPIPQPMPPVRGSKPASTKAPAASSSSKPRSADIKPVEGSTKKKISGYDFKAWEKFDVEGELEELDNEDKVMEEQRRQAARAAAQSKKEQEERRRQQQEKDIAEITSSRGGAEAIAAMTIVERESLAENEKLKGNDCFRANEPEPAYLHYSKSIAIYEAAEFSSAKAVAVVYTNRAAAALKLDKLQQGEDDCTRALELDDTFVKAWTRRGIVRHKRGRYPEAVQDFTEALKRCPAAQVPEVKKLLDQSIAKDKEVNGEPQQDKEIFTSSEEWHTIHPEASSPPPLPPGWTSKPYIHSNDDKLTENSGTAVESDTPTSTPASVGFTRIQIQMDDSDSEEETEERSIQAETIVKENEHSMKKESTINVSTAQETQSGKISEKSTEKLPEKGEKKHENVERLDVKGSISASVRADSDAEKVRGNSLMSKGDAQGAIDAYTRALVLWPGNVAALGNRSQAKITLGMWKSAAEDSTAVLNTDPEPAVERKALYRRAVAYLRLAEKRGAGKVSPTEACEILKIAKSDLERLHSPKNPSADVEAVLKEVDIALTNATSRLNSSQDPDAHGEDDNPRAGRKRTVSFSDGTVPGDDIPTDAVQAEADKAAAALHADVAKTHWPAKKPGVHYRDGSIPGDFIPVDEVKLEVDKQLAAEHPDTAKTHWPLESKHQTGVHYRDGSLPGDVIPVDEAKQLADKQLAAEHANSAKTHWPPEVKHPAVHYRDGSLPGDVIPVDELKLEQDKKLALQKPDVAKAHWQSPTANAAVRFNDGSQPGDSLQADKLQQEKDRQLASDHPETAKTHWPLKDVSPTQPAVHFRDGSLPGDSLPIDEIKLEADKLLAAQHPDVARTHWPSQTQEQHTYINEEQHANSNGGMSRIPIMGDSDEEDEAPVKQMDIEQATVHKERGNALLKANDLQGAINAYTEGLTFAPGFTPLVNNRCLAYLQAKDYANCIKDADTVLSQEPLNTKALTRRGVAYTEQHKYAEARADFSAVLQLEPENPAAKKGLARVTDEEKHSKQTIEKHSKNSIQTSTDTHTHTKPTNTNISNKSERKGDGTLRRNSSNGSVTDSVADFLSGPKAAEAAKLLRERGRAAPTSAPKTLYEFERAWRDVKDIPDAYDQYLRLLKGSALTKILNGAGTQSTDIIPSIIRHLDTYTAQKDAQEAVRILQALSKMKGLGLTLMMLSDIDRAALSNVVHTTEAEGLRAKFGLR